MKKNLLFILGIPIVLLLLSTVLTKMNSISKTTNVYNPYLNKLPLKYTKAVENIIKKKKSAFSCAITEEYGIREFIIVKPFPEDNETKMDFDITVFPSQNEKKTKPIQLVSKNNIVLYNYNNKTYGIYKKALPYINIDKIEVKRKVINKYQKKFFDTIVNPIEPSKENSKTDNINLQKNPYKNLFLEELEDNNIQFLPTSYTIKKDDLFKTSKNLEQYITAENITVGSVKNASALFKSLNNNNPIASYIKFQGTQSIDAVALVESLDNKQEGLNSIFNLNQLASYMAIKELYSNGCKEDLHFIYNTENKILEPFFVNSNCLGKTLSFLTGPKLNNLEFIESYLNKLNELSLQDIYQDKIVYNANFEKELQVINTYNPENIFDLDNLKINQRVINNNIHEELAIKTELISVDNKKIVFTVINLSYYPVVIKGLSHKKKKDIASINPSKVILKGEKDTIQIDLPRSFENLFVSKKNKKIGFVLGKHVYQLFVAYNIYGLDKKQFSAVLPYQPKEEVANDLFRESNTIAERKDIEINEAQKTISFNTKNTLISTPLIIPEGYTFNINPGTTVDIVNGGKIISKSPVSFNGTKEEPIKIFSSDKKGQGILVFSEGKKNIVNHTTFDFLSNLQHGYWNVSGAVNFYEAPVKLNYVTVSNNRCEDALNIIRTNFVIDNCLITNTQSDAFDGDFVTGTVKNSKFVNLGNDAIDVSGSDLIINNVQIIKADDKGLSAGEDSKMTVNKVSITTSAIAVAGKDLSIINAKNLTIKDTKLAFTAFQKKPEFGPSNITVSDVKMTNVETDHLVESTSSLIIDGKKVETAQNVKDRMYGAEFGVSSDDTRNKEYKN